MELAGRRLLILGGSYCKNAIRQFADDNEVTLVAVGYDPNAGIVDIADEYYNINSTDAEAMKKLIEKKKIDGVYMGSSEPVIDVAISYVTELGLPCYCKKEQWNLLQNKKEFKNLCASHGLPVVPCYNFEDEVYLQECEFPVITKPADGCGSSCFSVCYNNDELKAGYELAENDSATGSVICEKFVKNEGVVVFYTFSDGNAYLTGIEDKYPIKFEKQGSYVAGLLSFPSRVEDEFKKKFHDKIVEMFKDIDIKEGTVWMEVFHDGEDYYFNEAGYRYGGSVSVYPVNYLYDINQVAADMYFSLTGESKINGHTSMIPASKNRKARYCVYPLMLRPGKIGEIKGVKELEKNDNFILIPEIRKVGAEIKDNGTVGQTFSYIHFVYDSFEELQETIDLIHNTVKVLDVDGDDMVTRMLDIRNVKYM